MPSLTETVKDYVATARDLNQQYKEGNTLLHLAVLEHNTEIIQLLLQCEVQRQVKNDWGMTPAELGKWLNYKESWELIEPPQELVIPFQVKGESELRKLSPAQFTKLTGVHYIPQPYFESLKTLKRVFQLCTKIHRRGWVEEEQLWLGALFRPDIEQQKSVSYSIRWVDDQVEYGLYAEEPIPSGTFIGEYAGEIKRRRFWSFFQLNDYCFRYPTSRWGRPYFTINAQDSANYTRYINHSGAPNLECASVFSQGLFRLAFRSVRDIEVGEQLCYDYGPYYWRHRQGPVDL